jgi:hypothetical protein
LNKTTTANCTKLIAGKPKNKNMKNTTINLVLISIITFFISCNSNDDEINNSFTVTVLREGDKCGIIDEIPGTLDYLIEFNESTTDLSVSNERVYYAANLPEKYKVENLKIKITFREINESDKINCTAIVGGEVFPFIYILTAN